MKKADFRFLDRVRVRWHEVDSQRVVFSGNYFTYFIAASAEYWRALCVRYPEALTESGGDLFVKRSTIEYHGSARYDDVLEIGIRCAKLGNSSVAFDWIVCRDDEILVTGEALYVFVDGSTQRSRSLPGWLREVLQTFEAGGRMLER
jgi:YbgC/YbaW family acyl-CoA thioester hydrolase